MVVPMAAVWGDPPGLWDCCVLWVHGSGSSCRATLFPELLIIYVSPSPPSLKTCGAGWCMERAVWERLFRNADECKNLLAQHGAPLRAPNQAQALPCLATAVASLGLSPFIRLFVSEGGAKVNF